MGSCQRQRPPQGRAAQVEEVAETTETEVKVDPVEKLCLALALPWRNLRGSINKCYDGKKYRD